MVLGIIIGAVGGWVIWHILLYFAVKKVAKKPPQWLINMLMPRVKQVMTKMLIGGMKP